MQLVYSSVPNRRYPKFHHIYGKQAIVIEPVGFRNVTVELYGFSTIHYNCRSRPSLKFNLTL